jgi:uncharacterized protein (DUF1778 family)
MMKTRRRRWTKRPRLFATAVRLYDEDRRLIHLAAAREGIAQSEFLRAAIRSHAAKVLALDGGGRAGTA